MLYHVNPKGWQFALKHSFDRVAAEKPGIAMVHNNRAMALLGLEEFEPALAATGLA